MPRFLLLAGLLLSLPAHAYLTSDVNVNAGYTSLSMKAGDNSINLTSLTSLNFNYNLSNARWNTAFVIEMSEATQSSQGPLAWTRIGFGAKHYLTGFGGQRVIFDNRVEGVYWRPAPYVGGSLGISTISVSNVGGETGSLNASIMDLGLKAGAEVVMTSNYFLIGELNLLQGLAAQSSRSSIPFSMSGLAVYLGLKIAVY